MKVLFQFRNTAIAFAAILTTAIANPLNATEDPKTAAAELKFVGNFQNKPVFELNFTNASAEKDYILTVRDAVGNSLYRETIEGNVFTKKFLLNTDEIQDDVIRIEISSRKNKHTLVYEVNRNSRMTEEVRINKIN